MPTSPSSSHTANPLLASYAAALGAEGPLNSDRLSLTVDERYRVQLRGLSDGRIQVRARLRALPQAGAARDELLHTTGALACGRMHASAAACVIDPDEHAIWLSQVMPTASAQEIDELVGAFVNELSFWEQVVPKE